MQDAVSFLADAIGSLVFFMFLLRLLLQLCRADFRNPLAQGVMTLTNWLVMPLRKVLPSLGKIDTATVIAALLVALACVAVSALVRGLGLPDPFIWLRAALRMLLQTALWVYFWAILLGVILSWVAPGGYSPAQSLLYSLTEPVLKPLRKLIPALGGFDFSPVLALLAIQFVQILLR